MQHADYLIFKILLISFCLDDVQYITSRTYEYMKLNSRFYL